MTSDQKLAHKRLTLLQLSEKLGNRLKVMPHAQGFTQPVLGVQTKLSAKRSLLPEEGFNPGLVMKKLVGAKLPVPALICKAFCAS